MRFLGGLEMMLTVVWWKGNGTMNYRSRMEDTPGWRKSAGIPKGEKHSLSS
jgi:hypothetical protein